MPPKLFYEIDPKTYLFGKSLTNDIINNRRKTPEEKVRQWVLFELLSSYGYNINEIKIEVPSKMGSGYHPADIVIYHDHQPYIVIECKKIGSNKQDDAIKQAVTYATGLKTQFAVYADGQNWIVKRHLSGHWVDVNDIPPKSRLIIRDNFSLLFWFVLYVRPFLYWLYKTVPTRDAPKFFRELDKFTFFMGFNYLRNLNRDLHYGINNIVKVIFQHPSESNQTSFTVNEYRLKNFKIAVSNFQKYLNDTGSSAYLIENLDFDSDTRSFSDLVDVLYVELNSTVLNLANIISEDVISLRFAVALLKYLKQITEKSSYLPIEPNVTNDLYNLINLILITEYGVELPDNLDVDSLREIEGFSSEIWIGKSGELNDKS